MLDPLMLKKGYDDCRNRLKKYMLFVTNSNGFSHDQADNLLAECQIDSLLSDMLSDKKDTIRNLYLDIVQSKFNELCRYEIRMLTACANEAGIRLILLKGVVFSDHYYYRPEKRRSGDIDVFVSLDDFVQFIQICKLNGYRFENNTEVDLSTVTTYQKDYLRDHHFNVLYKSVDQMKIHMDVHVSLIHYPWFFGNSALIPRDFWKRSVKSNVAEMEYVYELELHDLIIYLCIHFLQHFYKKIWAGFSQGELTLDKSMNLLFDLACVLAIQKDEIDWLYFCKLCSNYQIDCETGTVLSFMHQIFGDLVPLNVICRLEEQGNTYHKDLFYYSICRYTSKMKLHFLLLNPAEKWLGEFIDYVIGEKKIWYCKATCDTVLFDGINAYGSKSVASNMNLRASASWNKHFLDIALKIKYKDIPISHPDVWKHCIDSDQNFVVIGIHGFDHSSATIQIKPLSVYYKKKSLETLFTCDEASVDVFASSSTLLLRVPWETLGFLPKTDKSIGLSVVWTHYETEIDYAILSLSGNPIWHDITGMLRIKLSGSVN